MLRAWRDALSLIGKVRHWCKQLTARCITRVPTLLQSARSRVRSQDHPNGTSQASDKAIISLPPISRVGCRLGNEIQGLETTDVNYNKNTEPPTHFSDMPATPCDTHLRYTHPPRGMYKPELPAVAEYSR
ncbi:unnamed protein product [Peniophora sp. CBMAI 1063]|nr:unnamed protein product [Peniophora sp. CBMAI 1063]